MTAPQLEFEIRSVAPRQDTFTLTLEPDALTFVCPKGDEAYRIRRAECPERLSFRESGSWINGLKKAFGVPNLTAKIPKATHFKVGPEVLAALTEWRGPLTHADLMVALRRQIGWLWMLPLGILLVLTFLPLVLESLLKGEGLAFDPVTMLVLGLLLLVLPILREVWPRPVLFLLVALWTVGLSANLTVAELRGRSSVYWLLLLPILLLSAAVCISEYFRFAGVSFTGDDAEADPEAIRDPEAEPGQPE